MAEGQLRRDAVADPNAPARGNAPRERLSVSGIMSPAGPQRQSSDNGLTQAIARFGQVGEALAKKQENADYLKGQMAQMSGKTEADIAETGNRTTMAGFVSLEVGSALNKWHSQQLAETATKHYSTDPDQYATMLSEQAAELISSMGGDQFAEQTLSGGLAKSMEDLAAAQRSQHQKFLQQETANSYTNALVTSGNVAARTDADITNQDGPQVSGTRKPSQSYTAYAESLYNRTVSVESAGNRFAKNPNSSATGLSQFIDSTWLQMIKQHRPDLAGKSRAELLELRKNPKLDREMNIAFTAQNARGLAQSGLPVRPGTSYLAHFAGLGGARRVLKGDPRASVDTTLTKAAIEANRSIMYKNGKLITNGELVAWADKKHPPVSGEPMPTKQAIFTNPGLPPDVHRTSIANAMVATLQNGDSSLFETSGGMASLREVGLTPTQLAQVKRAHTDMLNKRQRAYNSDYERAKHDLIQKAGTGNFTEDELFAELDTLNGTYARSPEEAVRVHQAVQAQFDKEANKTTKMIWNNPDRQYDLMQIQQDVLDGEMDPKEAIDAAVEIGEMYGAKPEDTAAVVAKVIATASRVKEQERQAIRAAAKAGAKAKEVTERARVLVSRNSLGTGSAAERKAGVKLLEQEVLSGLEQAGVTADQLPAKANAAMTKALVQNDVVDEVRASQIRASLARPVDDKGKVSPGAIEAVSFFMDLKRGANASPEYLTKMFKGDEKTLTFLLNVEEAMGGDAGSVEIAINNAVKRRDDPVTREMIKQRQAQMANGTYINKVTEQIVEASGLTDSIWNRTMNMFSSTWEADMLDDEERDRVLQDSGLKAIVDQEVRSFAALHPDASPSTAAAIVAGQVAERGAIMGSSFVVAPPGKTMREVMGINSKEANVENTAINAYITENGKELFGEAVWNDIGPSLIKSLIGTDATPGGNAGSNVPRFTVEHINGVLLIHPASKHYAFEDGWFFDKNASMPEAAPVSIPAAEVGKWYNAKQQEPTLFDNALNAIVDLTR